MSVVLVTRPAGEADPLVAMLEARGYAVRAVPAVAIAPREVDWPDLGAYDWVVATSAAAVASVPDPGAARRWAAVGKATADALRARGADPAVMPDVANAEALGGAIPQPQGARVLFVRGSLASGELTRILRARGATVDEVVAYDTLEGPESSRSALEAAVAHDDVDAVVFASGSAVRGFVKLGGSPRIPAVTIGPRTTAAARAAGFEIAAEASGQSAAELAAAVVSVVPLEVESDA